MANKKYKLTDGNYWATDGIHDFGQNKTQREINAALVQADSDLSGAITSINNQLNSAYQSASVEQSVFSEGAVTFCEIGNLVLVNVTNLKFININSGVGAFATGLPTPNVTTAVSICSYTNKNNQRLQVTTNGTLNNYWSDFAANEVIYGQFWYKKS